MGENSDRWFFLSPHVTTNQDGFPHGDGEECVMYDWRTGDFVLESHPFLFSLDIIAVVVSTVIRIYLLPGFHFVL